MPPNAAAPDVLIVGSGIAGLRFALAVAEHASVRMVTKKQDFESNTNYAQGGIASVLASDDSFELHVADTLTAGAGLCHEDVVRRVVRAGPSLIAELAEQGIRFSRSEEGRFVLGREGGHSRRRIVHAVDFTGRELETALLHLARAHPRIEMLEDHLAVQLLQADDGRVVGCVVLDRQRGVVQPCPARVTVLATGGSGKVYLYTSNPDIATGDGPAMAYRAGARLANLEFVQFHPTCLFHPAAKNFLISEAVRGEGAVLRNLGGEAFMERYHPQADLAPRDIVARAIDLEMKQRGEDHVLLDTTMIQAEHALQRFPNIALTCRRFGFDLTRSPLPVVPAAHYQCGGVVTNEHAESDLPGLFVIGEAACTGLHGANRLASNSLLEALYFAQAASRRVLEQLAASAYPPAVPPRRAPAAATGTTRVLPTAVRHDWDVARRTMWDYVGIVRDTERLCIALERMEEMSKDAQEWVGRCEPDADLIELGNVTLLGTLVIRCALYRAETRGLHAMAGIPGQDPRFVGDTQIFRDGAVRLAPLPQAGDHDPRKRV